MPETGDETQGGHEEHGTQNITGELPPAPNPSADPGVIPAINTGDETRVGGASTAHASTELDVSTMEPLTAMQLLASSVQALADMTGDVPPTPPISRPGTPSSLQDIRSDSLTRPRTQSRPTTPPSHIPSDEAIKAVLGHKDTPLGSPEAHPMESYVSSTTPSDSTTASSSTTASTTAADRRAIREQRIIIARKFFSKKPPPVSIHDYLARLHRYCPMSTAVYLAAGSYIQRLALVDRSVPVTARTVHRLLLAALRVAMKALEDLSYPHKRFAGVGGVVENELAKLEVCLCYLVEFELRVTLDGLGNTARGLQQLASGKGPGGSATKIVMALQLPV